MDGLAKRRRIQTRAFERGVRDGLIIGPDAEWSLANITKFWTRCCAIDPDFERLMSAASCDNGYSPHARSVAPVLNTCQNCGGAFTALRADAKTCSDRCRTALQRAKQSERAREEAIAPLQQIWHGARRWYHTTNAELSRSGDCARHGIAALYAFSTLVRHRRRQAGIKGAICNPEKIGDGRDAWDEAHTGPLGYVYKFREDRDRIQSVQKTLAHFDATYRHNAALHCLEFTGNRHKTWECDLYSKWNDERCYSFAARCAMFKHERERHIRLQGIESWNRATRGLTSVWRCHDGMRELAAQEAKIAERLSSLPQARPAPLPQPDNTARASAAAARDAAVARRYLERYRQTHPRKTPSTVSCKGCGQPIHNAGGGRLWCRPACKVAYKKSLARKTRIRLHVDGSFERIEGALAVNHNATTA